MMANHLKLDLIRKTFKDWNGSKADFIQKLPQTASYREYYRISFDQKTVIGVINEDLNENEAFISFSKSFRELNLNVPTVLHTDLANNVYLLNDLGDTTLYSLIHMKKHDYSSSPELVMFYRRALEELLKFQIIADRRINYKHCYPRSKFDRQSILWDLNYLKMIFRSFRSLFHQLIRNIFFTVISNRVT
jgi:aminoglycoside/choline kinase family phosphotransferase